MPIISADEKKRLNGVFYFMPIPNPKTNENKDDYISRCVGFLIDEGKEQKQAIAICSKQWEESMKMKTYTISEVPILKEGKFTDANGVEVNLTSKVLSEIVSNTNALIKAKQIEPPLKFGHNEEQKITDGLPAIGWVAKLSKIGNQVFADFVDIPKKVYNLIQNRAYAKISSELYENLKTENNEDIGFVLRAVALLGADIPAIKGLGDIEKLYASEMPFKILAFAEKDLEEVNSMSSNLWTLERVKNSIPCCAEAVAKFMEEHKLEAIEVEDLIKIISEVKMSEMVKLQTEQEDEAKKRNDYLKEIANKKEMTKEDTAQFIDEFKKLTAEKLAEIKNLQDDQKPPKEWLDGCIASVPAEVSDPSTLCEWIYSQWMGDERKAELKGAQAADAEKNKKEEEMKAQTEADEKEKLLAEKKEAENKLKEAEKSARISAIKELTEKNRGVFLPAFDSYITALSEVFASSDSIIKFSEKDEKASDIFIKFLSEIAKSKVVIFEELMKSESKEKHDEIMRQKVDAKMSQIKSKYENIGHSFAEGDLELVALATVISEDEKIDFAKALGKAKKSLNK